MAGGDLGYLGLVGGARQLLRVAAVQAHPAWLDPEAGARLVVGWLEQAGREGVELAAFPESFLPGYPFWVMLEGGERMGEPRQLGAYRRYIEAAVRLDGPELAQIIEAARDLGVFCYLGIAERGTGPARGSVYATLVAIDPNHGIVSAHRKLKPTYTERTVWADGDGHGLRVHELTEGVRVGGLNCWENWMPLARFALYAAGEDVHVLAFPGSRWGTELITRAAAFEGRVFTIAASGLLGADDVPEDFPLREAIVSKPAGWYDGGSCIAGPDGQWVVEPVVGEERLVIADLEIGRVSAARHLFDPTGHYHRPDVFGVSVDRSRRVAATFDDGATDGAPAGITASSASES